MQHNSRFFGVWELDPTSCQYSMGKPPESGRYEIQPQGELLKFTLAWRDDQRPHQMEFTANPDGKPHPFENPALADTMTLTYQGENLLESWNHKDGTCLGYTKRELIDEGRKMIVSQEVESAQGKLVNRSMYRRV